MARSIRVMWRSAKDRGTNDNNNGCSCNNINNRRRIRNMVKQLDEIGRDRDPQVVSMIAIMLEPIQYIHYLFVCYAGGILFLRLQQIRGGRKKQIGDGDGDGDEVVDEREGGV